MNAFDVRIHTIRRRKNKRLPFEVRWRVAGRDKSKSFLTRALADGYRAELVRAARQGLEFDPATGEPLRWAVPEPAVTAWLEHAVAYADMKWPRLAPHSRASLADALATVTPLLTRETGRMPSASRLRAALYGHAFNPSNGSPACRIQTPPTCWGGWNTRRCRSASSATRGSSGPPWTAVHQAGWLARGGEHGQAQAGGVPQRARLRRRTRTAAR